MRLTVVSGEERHDLARSRHLAREHDDIGPDRRVSVVRGDHAAIGVHGEGVVEGGDRALVVLPPAVQDPTIAQHARVEVVEHVVAELLDVRSIRGHAEEQGRVAVAAAHHEVLRPVRREPDAPVGQIEGLAVVLRPERELLRCAARDGDLVDVVALAAIPFVRAVTEGEEQLPRLQSSLRSR